MLLKGGVELKNLFFKWNLKNMCNTSLVGGPLTRDYSSFSHAFYILAISLVNHTESKLTCWRIYFVWHGGCIRYWDNTQKPSWQWSRWLGTWAHHSTYAHIESATGQMFRWLATSKLCDKNWASLQEQKECWLPI